MRTAIDFGFQRLNSKTVASLASTEEGLLPAVPSTSWVRIPTRFGAHEELPNPLQNWYDNTPTINIPFVDIVHGLENLPVRDYHNCSLNCEDILKRVLAAP